MPPEISTCLSGCRPGTDQSCGVGLYWRQTAVWPACRGTLVSIQPGAVFSAPPTAYIADHDTAPPEDQVVKSDPTSLLIRALHSKKSKEDAKRKQAKAAGGWRCCRCEWPCAHQAAGAASVHGQRCAEGRAHGPG